MSECVGFNVPLNTYHNRSFQRQSIPTPLTQKIQKKLPQLTKQTNYTLVCYSGQEMEQAPYLQPREPTRGRREAGDSC